MFCKNCGNEIKSGSKFCTNCGYIIEIENSKYSFIKKNQSIIAALIIMVLGSIFVMYSFNKNQIIKTNKNIEYDPASAVVNLVCDNGYKGSGTIFTSDGTIITNYHVIANSSACVVTLPDPTSGQISEVYDATPVVNPEISKDYDIALVKINGVVTTDGITHGKFPNIFKPFSSPNSCNLTKPSVLGDSVKIYGYPVTSGGYNLTITEGIISSFSEDGSILTSAKVDNGNSGGLAIDQNGCWLGIPSAVVSGNFQNLGAIIPGNVIKKILVDVPSKALPNNTPDYLPAPVANGKTCQSSYGQNSIWSGKTNDKGNPTCLCENGYSWDSSGSSCVLTTTLQSACTYEYGYGSYSYTSSGKAVCGCSSGYVWNGSNTKCVLIPSCPANSEYNTSSGICQCQVGYYKSGGSCMSGYDYCQNLDGYGSTYDSSTNSCGCISGYTYWGGQCTSNASYCSEKWGTGATYDYSTNSCACGYGYATNSSRTACVYVY